MIKSILNVTAIKDSVQNLYNKKVKVVQNLGRNKFITYTGVVSGIYPALFTIAPTSPTHAKTTFSYSEVLCGSVKLKQEQK